jgi:hypothetical protein
MKVQIPAQKPLKVALQIFLFAHYIHILVEKGLISRDQLPSKFSIKAGTGQIFVDFGLNQQATKTVARNMVIACLGMCVNIFDGALEETFQPSIKKFSTKDNSVDDLTAARAIINQMRNAFAHRPERPTWRVKNPNFLRAFQVKQINLTVDLQELNGQLIKPGQVGGYKAFFDLFKYCFDEVGKAQPLKG